MGRSYPHFIFIASLVLWVFVGGAGVIHSKTFGPEFRFPASGQPGWWEGWWTRSEVFKAILREGIPTLGQTRDDEDRVLIGSTELADFVLWALAGVRITDPYTFLQAEFPQLARIELESSSLNRSSISSLPRWRPPSSGRTGEPVQPVQPSDRPRSLKNSQEPLVLIYHTHASESFAPALGAGSSAEAAFSSENERNVVRVGNEIAWMLQELGVPVAHLTDPFDAEGRGGAYHHSEIGVRQALQQYPSLRILLDIHRDSVGREATTVTIDGVSYAKVLLVLGTNRKLTHDNWRRNQAWMDTIGQALEDKYPGLLRKLKDGDADDLTYIRPDRFNQHLSPGAALIEIGGAENTLDEVLRTARVVAEILADLIAAEQYPG